MALSNDYEIALLGLAQMLAPYPDQVQIVDLTTESHMSHEPDVILYDTFGRLPRDDVKLRHILEQNTAHVVVYSWDDYPEEAALEQGAVAYLHKGLTAAELVAAITAIHDRVPVSTDALERTAAADSAKPIISWPGQSLGLSARESEILTFITRGLSNEEIAQRAYISINTVKSYIRHAYRKIGATNRAQAVAWGYRHGFQSTDNTAV